MEERRAGGEPERVVAERGTHVLLPDDRVDRLAGQVLSHSVTVPVLRRRAVDSVTEADLSSGPAVQMARHEAHPFTSADRTPASIADRDRTPAGAPAGAQIRGHMDRPLHPVPGTGPARTLGPCRHPC